MGLKDGEAVSILNDNAGAIALSKNPVHHNRYKAYRPPQSLPTDTFDRLRGLIGLSPRMTRSLRSEE